ncbi:RNA polymerase sigma-70 factor [Prolixibacter denitrificans]|uniref:DNA-directed RNA polymerase sigma-70 factor n=1 Tax=Prolixibacter denitrificans TaxID=1541063 RepID=A0A2P8C824_9BACT|nr:RNA polymerase sigma-70 factor [Prolixibacter denitrificans]PSK81123.1 RNA polymerase sigma-70 factor (ECF subfamily) [Prolixibacter denitrificans]GET22239.1 DNA-directed RNA polymerase sigma-70 factor [Prolixibacter denitrificans]
MPTNTLFNDIRLGDKKAFDKLFLVYYGELCRFAYTFAKDFDHSEEIVQRMFVRIWENRKKLIEPENGKSYLYKAVYNEYLKHRRSEDVRKQYHLSYILNKNDDEEETESYQQVLPLLNKAIDMLPEKCRQIFVLNKLEGLTQKEIAEYLNISVKTVENQVAIAVSKLREELKPYLHLLPATLLLIVFH